MKKNPFLLAKRLADSSQLREIALKRLKVEAVPEKLSSPVDVKLNYKIEQVRDGDKKETIKKNIFDATLQIKGVKDKEIVLNLSLTYRVHYEVGEITPPITGEEITAFANLNVPYNVWPYWREHVQNLVVRMGLPPYTLPLFKPVAHAKQVQKLLRKK